MFEDMSDQPFALFVRGMRLSRKNNLYRSFFIVKDVI